ncbi:hypothetical protein AGRA3207_001600 [Actinomadura graeca]|uniref:Uncharacterized protein n=1 Tax=Actinomadura graeca TaxID=2750812 RepID=A0ABX8QQ49_9ACTN|nr:hypothetical protein [Actinomadura graeca]QXJ20821.1 hypothetical protein AGRA3207_001600 [Actinomadura graeca]
MLRTWMIAEYLRPYAQWRINRADPGDDGRNARAAIGLIDAAVYTTQLDDGERVIVRMAAAGCFARGHFDPGAEGEALVRHWHYDGAEGGPAELLEALAASAERRPRAAAALPLPRTGEAAPA